jgi:S-adenosyl-L-methionine hydrolase (adenosine-forming)
MPKPPIAILTDFGYRDHYVGAMKGVIASIAPDAPIVDITHGIPPQSIVAGSIALAQSWRFFPKGTVFLAVVDPGVGTARLPIAIETRAGARFVGPDNGLLMMAARDAKWSRAHELRSPRYRLPNPSVTFHGRDIFAPAAAHIWKGTPLRSLGPRVPRVDGLAIDPPERNERSISGAVIYIDGFGNLVTNIDRESVELFRSRFPKKRVLVRLGKSGAIEIRAAYADAAVGAPLATFGSFELLEIAVRDGNAAHKFRVKEGTRVGVVVIE